MSDLTPNIEFRDGLAVVNWPGPDPFVVAITRAVFEDIASVVNELAALKARRCDGCAWGDDPNPNPTRAPIKGTEDCVHCIKWRNWTPTDHACNA